MAYKDIIVHQGEDAHADRRLKAALDLAKKHDSRLTGVYVLSYPTIPGFVQTELPSEIIEERYNEIRAAAKACGEAFDATTEREGVASEFRVMEGDVSDAIALCGRYSDLIVVGQPDPDHPSPHDSLAEDLLMAAGRPVFVVPYAGDQSHTGERVMMAWSATRESTRAVHDAMPVLKMAEVSGRVFR